MCFSHFFVHYYHIYEALPAGPLKGGRAATMTPLAGPESVTVAICATVATITFSILSMTSTVSNKADQLLPDASGNDMYKSRILY